MDAGTEVESMLWVEDIEFSTRLRQVVETGLLDVTGSVRVVELEALEQKNLVVSCLVKCRVTVAKWFLLVLWSVGFVQE